MTRFAGAMASTLPPRGRVELATSVSLAVHTTRKPRPGNHRVDVPVNGEARPAGSFQVIAARRSPPRRCATHRSRARPFYDARDGR